MFPKILKNIESFSDQNIQAERKFALQKLVDYINKKREPNWFSFFMSIIQD